MLTHVTLMLLCIFCVSLKAQTSLSMASHWGAISSPAFNRGYQAGATVLSFTQFDAEGKQFGNSELANGPLVSSLPL